jgi:N-formylglutamate amidohydrolase
LYRNFGGYSRGILSRTESQHLLDMRSRHLERLKSLLTPGSLLIDCHSFPAELYDCDICIGFNDDQSYDSGLVGLVKNKFEEMHYAVSLNAPYSHSITPSTGFAYKSIMIEVNKRIYLEKSRMLNPNSRQWMRWYGCMNRIYNAVLNYGND